MSTRPVSPQAVWTEPATVASAAARWRIVQDGADLTIATNGILGASLVDDGAGGYTIDTSDLTGTGLLLQMGAGDITIR